MNDNEDGKLCARPPRGWWCGLPAGHDGPCPTYPTLLNYVWRRLRGKPC